MSVNCKKRNSRCKLQIKITGRMNAQKRGTQVDKAALYRRIILPIRSDKAFKELFNCSPVYEVQFYNGLL